MNDLSSIRNHRGETMEECAQRLAVERNGSSELFAKQVALVCQIEDRLDDAVFYRMVAHLLEIKGH